jgi:hypothetical protein
LRRSAPGWCRQFALAPGQERWSGRHRCPDLMPNPDV